MDESKPLELTRHIGGNYTKYVSAYGPVSILRVRHGLWKASSLRCPDLAVGTTLNQVVRDLERVNF